MIKNYRAPSFCLRNFDKNSLNDHKTRRKILQVFFFDSIVSVFYIFNGIVGW